MIGDVTTVKSRRLTAVGSEDAADDTNHQGPSSSSFAHSATVSNFPMKLRTHSLSLTLTSSSDVD